MEIQNFRKIIEKEKGWISMKRETVIVFTKYLLDFMFFAGIIVTLTLPLPGVVQKIMDFF